MGVALAAEGVLADPLSWDGHLALLHATEGGRRAGLAAWVRRGLERDETVVYAVVPDEEPQRSVLDGLREHGVGVESALDRNRLHVVSVGVLYEEASRQLIVDRALRDGAGAVRITVEATAALAVVPWRRHAAFERALDGLCRRAMCSALCQYDGAAERRWPLDEVTDFHAGGIRERQLATQGEPGGLLVAGQVDLDNQDVLAGVLRATTSRVSGTSFRLDLSQVSFLGVGGCRAVLAGTQPFRDTGGQVLLVRPAPAVDRVLRLLQCDHLPGLQIVTGSPA